MLYLLAYAFLLRVPSEAVRATRDGITPGVSIEGSFVVMTLAKRKKKPHGSRLVRRCWCAECRETCPYHVLKPLLENTQPGERLFKNVTPASALSTLRIMLQVLGTPHAELYRTHDLPRGHATDLQLSGRSEDKMFVLSKHVLMLGAPHWEILRAGEWKSPAFLAYLDLHRDAKNHTH